MQQQNKSGHFLGNQRHEFVYFQIGQEEGSEAGPKVCEANGIYSS